MDRGQVLAELKKRSNPKNVEGMARFGINPEGTLGVPVPIIRELAKKIGKSHFLARELWGSGVHEAKILACLVEDWKEVSEQQMEDWVKGFDSWDVCDQVCMNLFDKTPFAYSKAEEWSKRKEEFVKRAGFALMASLSVHDKKAIDAKFEAFLPLIEQQSHDERNFVRKAVNWALRQVGKRNKRLNKKAISAAKRIAMQDSKSAKWIAKDALRELTGKKTLARLK